eukprot:PITA_22159
MALVSSSSFSILVNGSPSEIFNPSRGLRQGDPLSPFLFILMMEGLGKSIKQAKDIGKIRGLQISENGFVLNHQQFVDDTLLQGVPTVKEVLAFKQILKYFSLATSMEVNLSKSKIFFFSTNIAIQRNISRILGFQRDSLPSKYLGIPLTARPMHKSIWEMALNKMQDRVNKWTFRALNLAGRLVLTKDVLQSIPIFMLSALPAPKGILEQIRDIQRDFMWGKEETIKKWALASWEKICKPKSQGGLGLDDQEILCKALGAKLWVRWVKEPKAQWARIWKENFWEIRAGDLALFWEDKWQQEPILLTENFFNLKQETDAQGLIRVKDFWDLSQTPEKWRSWRNIECGEDSPLKIKAEALGDLLKKMMILKTKGKDQLRWGNNKQGAFNLKEAKGCLLGLNYSVPDKTWTHLWRQQGWMKINTFMWLVHHKKILTWENIRKRGIMGPSRCQLCEEQEETTEHILNSCSYTTWLWDSFSAIFQQSDRDRGSIINTLNH